MMYHVHKLYGIDKHMKIIFPEEEILELKYPVFVYFYNDSSETRPICSRE